MKKLLALLFVGTIIVALAIALSNKPSTILPNQPTVAASFLPLYDITRQVVGGNEVEVRLILPPGASPHTFEPSPSTLQELQGAEVVYAFGHGVDDWTDQIVESIGAEKYVVDRNIVIRAAVDEEEGPDDPHYWLTVPNAMIITQTVADDLSARYPQYAEQFQTNAAGYKQRLEELDQEIRTKLADVENKNMITLHDAWYYFAEEYGLTIVGTFEPSAGREPTPQYLAGLTEAVATSSVKTLYSEPQLSTAGIESFADDYGLTIAVLDPEGSEERPTYRDIMKYNAETIAQNQ